MTKDYETCKLDKEDHVATVAIVPAAHTVRRTADLYGDLGEVLSALRSDNDVWVRTT